MKKHKRKPYSRYKKDYEKGIQAYSYKESSNNKQQNQKQGTMHLQNKTMNKMAK